MREVRWTPLALASLDKIVEYLEENWSEKEISNFLIILNSTIKRLQLYPQTSILIKGQNFRRTRINKQNSLIFKLTEEVIQILYIWDGRQNPKKLKKIINNTG